MRHFEEETEKATSSMESSGDERKPVKVLAEGQFVESKEEKAIYSR